MSDKQKELEKEFDRGLEKELKKGPEKKESEKVLEEANQIKEGFGGLESNVPVSSKYWDLLNQYRALIREDK